MYQFLYILWYSLSMLVFSSLWGLLLSITFIIVYYSFVWIPNLLLYSSKILDQLFNCTILPLPASFSYLYGGYIYAMSYKGFLKLKNVIGSAAELIKKVVQWYVIVFCLKVPVTLKKNHSWAIMHLKIQMALFSLFVFIMYTGLSRISW